MVVELCACLEIFYGFVARLLQPTFTTKWAWAGLGWVGLGVSQPCCRVYWGWTPAPADHLQPPGLGLVWAGCHRCWGGVEARDTV